LYSIVTLTSNS